MAIVELIRKFSPRFDAPIELDELHDAIVATGIRDHIWWWPVEMNTDVLHGEISYWEYFVEGEIHRCADIDFAKSLSIDWQRLVIAKEMLHILDPVGSRVATPAEIKHLIKHIVLPPQDQEPLHDGNKVLSDRFAIYQALAILFPWDMRQALLEPFKANKVTIADIARVTVLPLRYVTVVMSDLWPPAFEVISKVELD